jgi:tRNA pseudouridine55 synthase
MMTELPIDYVLLVDKPVGPTSHDVVAQARRALKTKRIGHTGTLDPFASGLLLLCVNRATRIAEYLTGLEKSYRAVARLDGTTATDDHTGHMLERTESWRTLSASTVEAALADIAAQSEQVPPAFSAKKVRGDRAYDLARAGASVELAPVSVRISDLQLLRFDPPDVEFVMSCSSGTYVRAVARDLGRALGTGAYLTSLRRTRIGVWRVDDAIPLAQLESGPAQSAVLALAEALHFLPAVQVTPDDVEKLVHGQALTLSDSTTDGLILRALADGKLVALLRRDGDQLRPHKVLAAPE